MAINKKVIQNGTRKYIVNLTGGYGITDSNSDITDEVVIDRSTLTGPDGVNVPGKIRIDEITWTVSSGYDYASLQFEDDDGDEPIEHLSGQGYMDYRPHGGKSMSATAEEVSDGDVTLTTVGGAGAGDTYSIMLNCSLKN